MIESRRACVVWNMTKVCVCYLSQKILSAIFPFYLRKQLTNMSPIMLQRLLKCLKFVKKNYGNRCNCEVLNKLVGYTTDAYLGMSYIIHLSEGASKHCLTLSLRQFRDLCATSSASRHPRASEGAPSSLKVTSLEIQIASITLRRWRKWFVFPEPINSTPH